MNRQADESSSAIGIGVFQDYYQLHQLQDLSPSTVSWITSLESFVMLAGVCC